MPDHRLVGIIAVDDAYRVATVHLKPGGLTVEDLHRVLRFALDAGIAFDDQHLDSALRLRIALNELEVNDAR